MKLLAYLTIGFLASIPLTRAFRPFLRLESATPEFHLFHLFTDSDLDGRPLQLRGLSDGRQIVVIDPDSPVLHADLYKGVLRSQARNTTIERADLVEEDKWTLLGPVGYLNNVLVTPTESLSEFYFKNATKDIGAQPDFVLDLPRGRTRGHTLANDLTDDKHFGWIVCPYHSFWQIFYYRVTAEVMPNWLLAHMSDLDCENADIKVVPSMSESRDVRPYRG